MELAVTTGRHLSAFFSIETLEVQQSTFAGEGKGPLFVLAMACQHSCSTKLKKIQQIKQWFMCETREDDEDASGSVWMMTAGRKNIRSASGVRTDKRLPPSVLSQSDLSEIKLMDGSELLLRAPLCVRAAIIAFPSDKERDSNVTKGT